MTTKTSEYKDAPCTPAVRPAFIPDDLSYMTNTEFGQEMLRLAAEIVAEQGTRTSEEINQLIDLMRGGAATDADLS